MKRISKKQTKEGKETFDLKSQLVRALADYDNLRKRTDLEREVLIKFSSERIISRFLPVLDNLEEAQKHLEDGGLSIIIEDFKKVLYDERLEEIDPKKGDFFDQNLHEAIESLPGGKKGQVAELSLKGWKFIDGPVLRYAKVKVYAEEPGKKGK